MLNSLILNGKLPHFDPTVYKEATEDSSAFLVWAISVKEEFKRKGNEYVEEFLVKFKVNGPTATFIMNNFKQGDGLILIGRLDKESDYVDPATNVKKTGGYIMTVKAADFAEGNRNSQNNSNNVPKNNKSFKPAPAGRPMPGPMPGRLAGQAPINPNGGRKPLGMPPLGKRK